MAALSTTVRRRVMLFTEMGRQDCPARHLEPRRGGSAERIRRLGGGSRCLVEIADDRVPFGKDAAFHDPLLRVLVDGTRVRLEDDALAGAEKTRIHRIEKAPRKFLLVVMSVAVGMQVDVGLRAPERSKVFAHV